MVGFFALPSALALGWGFAAPALACFAAWTASSAPGAASPPGALPSSSMP